MKKSKSPKNTPLLPTYKDHGSQGGKNQKPIQKGKESLKPRVAMKKVEISTKNTPLPPTNKSHDSQGGKNQKPIEKGKESHSNQEDPQWRENSTLGNKEL